jgi:hypothetical protein
MIHERDLIRIFVGDQSAPNGYRIYRFEECWRIYSENAQRVFPQTFDSPHAAASFALALEAAPKQGEAGDRKASLEYFDLPKVV